MFHFKSPLVTSLFQITASTSLSLSATAGRKKATKITETSEKDKYNLWVIVDRCGSLWVVVDRCGSLWVVVDHCGSFRVLVTTHQGCT